MGPYGNMHGLFNFKRKNTKLEIYLAKDQHTQWKLMYFEKKNHMVLDVEN